MLAISRGFTTQFCPGIYFLECQMQRLNLVFIYRWTPIPICLTPCPTAVCIIVNTTVIQYYLSLFPPPVLLHLLAILSTTFSRQGLTALKCEQILRICLVTAIMCEAVFSPRHIFCLNANGVQAREGEACQRQKQENLMAMVKHEDRWCLVAIEIACKCVCVSEKDELFPLINRLAKCLCISLFSSLSLLRSLSASLSHTHTQTCERRRIRYIQR